MSNWYYYGKTGEKVGPVSATSLKELARQGLITPETVVETETGKTATAGKVNGLTFPQTQPEAPTDAAIYGFDAGFGFPDLVSVGPTLNNPDPFAGAGSVATHAQPPSKSPSAFMNPAVLIPVSVVSGMLLMLPFVFLFGGNQERISDENKSSSPQATAEEPTANSALKQNVPADTLNAIKEAHEAFDLCMEKISGMWFQLARVSPNLGPGYHLSSSVEFARKQGCYDGLDQYMESIRKDIKKLNKSKYENTFKLYAILSQYEKAVKEPSGSANSYAEDLHSYRKEFTSALSLAELEW